jgi:uncharacterized protein (DUF1015 family)
MFEWLKNLWGKHDENDRVKSLEAETAHLSEKYYRKLGRQTIPTAKIVGSVGRAHELDSQFHYRERATTARYHNIQQALREGRPMEPIKVILFAGEYYVVDGHHRVAEALRAGYPDMNADVTELLAHDPAAS